MAHENDPNKIIFEHNLDDLLASAKKLKTELDGLSKSEQNLKRQTQESSNAQRQQAGNFKNLTAETEKLKETQEQLKNAKAKLNEWRESFRNTRKEMARSASQLNPIDTSEFSSGFTLSAKSLFGFGSAIKSAFSEMKSLQGMRHELAYLSDASGNAGKAMGAVFNIAAGSAISRATAQGVVRTLADQGLALTDAAGNASPKIEKLGRLAGDLQAATGIAASQWGSFTGELSFNYGLSEEGIKGITSALVGTGLRAQHLERAMQTVNKVMQTTAYIAGVPTDASMNKLTKSIGGAMKAFQKLGISAEKAGSFIEGIIDPENFEKNSMLFAQLGISASEYAGYLNDVNGQQKLMERVMGNLPALAQKLSSIQNPFARMEMAKSLGLDMQTVQRMANASKEQIQEIMREYEEKNKADEALAQKKKNLRKMLKWKKRQESERSKDKERNNTMSTKQNLRKNTI
jgi:predicted  nucleic acid-binding Zn-ribbon protein